MDKEKLISFALLFAMFSTCPQISYGENMSFAVEIAFIHSLDLTGNQLAFFPTHLLNQIDLEELWIDDNQISEIPFEIDRSDSPGKIRCKVE